MFTVLTMITMFTFTGINESLTSILTEEDDSVVGSVPRLICKEREGFEPPGRFYGCYASLRSAVL
jgi:hypothetical protein